MQSFPYSPFRLAAHGGRAGPLVRCIGILAVCCALLLASLPGAHAQPLASVDCAPQPRTAACQGKDTSAKAQKGEPTGAPAQRALLKSAVAGLAPQRKGVVDLYTIGVAGWADQDVFIKELDGALASLARVLPIDKRIVRLVNHKDTVRTTPLATRDNLAAALRAVGQLMNKSEDVLILFMTSHGTPEGFALQLPDREPVLLSPRATARILDGAGIVNRLVVVSACYSGIFVPPLANDNTIVLTAADAKSSSFGCAPDREWTFFGDALFNRSLRPGVDLQRAFNDARTTISEWELMERYPPSNPQAHFGPALVGKLEPLLPASEGAAR